ncbi:hypothetical protein BMW24_008970 [Mycobacterium heckeshornense]|nr:hypothetical protein ACT16_21995 [Mycobacterium heckeshornense]PIJ35234.1 hypothetical protein BMW24_008970 [Mycobacterium heckeshornense]
MSAAVLLQSSWVGLCILRRPRMVVWAAALPQSLLVELRVERWWHWVAGLLEESDPGLILDLPAVKRGRPLAKTGCLTVEYSQAY